MILERLVKNSFVVIGKEGSTLDGDGFIQRLWQDADGHFDQIAHLAKKDQQGNLVGLWGAMSDFSRSFNPWEDFNKGLYLAGAECVDDAEAPEGWTKWVIPSYEYLRIENDEDNIFNDTLYYMKENGYSLAGAVHDFADQKTGKNYMYFPIRKL